MGYKPSQGFPHLRHAPLPIVVEKTKLMPFAQLAQISWQEAIFIFIFLTRI
jgi:hypothetical protein